LASIEDQIEKRVHSGCIVGGRKPWDVSPRADQLQQEWTGRELTQSDYGLELEGGGGRREGSLERIESRVHSGRQKYGEIIRKIEKFVFDFKDA
jgi:hypothetical protein